MAERDASDPLLFGDLDGVTRRQAYSMDARDWVGVSWRWIGRWMSRFRESRVRVHRYTFEMLSLICNDLHSVKLISGSLSHENTGNQFGQASSIFTFILLATTAVLQIVCLNRGLKVYDSTLVVPVFYGVYTAVGFLDSLVSLFPDCASKCHTLQSATDLQ